MAFCIHCGRELADGARFYANCGTSVTAEPNQDKKGDQQKTVYDGKIHKCPNCGEQLDSFTATCPVCGYELRGTQVTSCVHELSKKLEKTDSLEKKIELISNFYIPNTKEDIYEFFILAYSNITAGAYGVDAWNVKLEQAYLKATETRKGATHDEIPNAGRIAAYRETAPIRGASVQGTVR